MNVDKLNSLWANAFELGYVQSCQSERHFFEFSRPIEKVPFAVIARSLEAHKRVLTAIRKKGIDSTFASG